LSEHHYAVFSELSPENKPMAVGFNARVFNQVDAKHGHGIDLDMETGVITLAPGTWHVSALSTVVYDSGSEPPEMVTNRIPANGGYARIRHADKVECPNEEAIVVGSVATANCVPSTMETYLTVHEPTRIVLEHQSGKGVAGVYLRVYTMNSKWHVFARIAIRRL
jgi:hypothetical protein